MSPLGWILTILYSGICIAFFVLLGAIIGGGTRLDVTPKSSPAATDPSPSVAAGAQ